jgi:hypothetical protein
VTADLAVAFLHGMLAWALTSPALAYTAAAAFTWCLL